MTTEKEAQTLRDNLNRRLNDLKTGYFMPSTRLEQVATVMPKRRELRGHFQKVYSIHWGGRGSELLVSASQDGKLIVWNANTTYKLNAIPLKSCWVMSCAFEQKSNELVASGGLDNVCSIYRLGEHEIGTAITPERELEAHLGYISCCRFLNENNIVTASGDSSLRLWDVSKGTCTNYFKEHSADVMSVAVHPDHKSLFISGSVDLECKLWDVRVKNSVSNYKASPMATKANTRYAIGFDEDETKGEEINASVFFKGHESDVNSVAFFPDGFAFGSGSDDATCRLWDIRACQQVNIFKNQGVLCGITSVEFSRSGRILFGGYDDHNLLGWDVVKNPSENGDESDPVISFRRHEGRVSSLSVHSEGKALATASWDTLIKIHA